MTSLGTTATTPARRRSIALFAALALLVGVVLPILRSPVAEATLPAHMVASVQSSSVNEGNSGTISMVFNISLNLPAVDDTPVDWSTTDGSARAGSDYVAETGRTVTFAAGQTTRTVSVTVNGDTYAEAAETFQVTAAIAEDANADSGQSGTGTINNDDAAASVVTIDDPSIAEGNSGSKQLTFTLTQSTATNPQPVEVYWSTANETATLPAGKEAATSADYSPVTRSLVTIPAATPSTTVSVTILGDTAVEQNQVFLVNLETATASNAVVGDASGTGTINDDDDPIIQFTSATFQKNEDGTGATAGQFVRFTVSLSALSGRTASASFDTSDDTATAPADYTDTTQTVTFSPGTNTNKDIDVPIVNDTVDEVNETFTAALTSPTNAICGTCAATGTITDNDGLPTLSVNDVSVNEGDSGTTNASFTVTLSPASGQAVAVNYATADGTAAQPGDYTSTAGTTTFAIGETSKTVTVPVNGDTATEGFETFNLVLTDPAAADCGTTTATDCTGTATIQETEAPTLTIGDAGLTEGGITTNTMTFTVTLSTAIAQPVDFKYVTVDGTAKGGEDFTATTTATTKTIAAAATTTTIDVPILGDNFPEPVEAFIVRLSAPTNSTIADGDGSGQITDDQATGVPTIAISDETVVENASTPTLRFTITVTAATPNTNGYDVDYTTTNGTATAGSDYTATSGRIHLPPAETTGTGGAKGSHDIDVPVTGDVLDEIDEGLTITLSNAGNATITDATGAGTITDDDGPQVGIGDATVTEGDTGATNASFTVSLSAASPQDLNVDYATAEGTPTGDGAATDPEDFTAVPTTTLTFTAGQISKTVSVAIKGDTLDDGDETFTVGLSNVTAGRGTLGDVTGVGTILDDDDPAISIADDTVAEPNTGTTANAEFVVTIPDSPETVTVDYTTANGTATAPGDYVTRSGTLTFAPHDTEETITVVVNADGTDEDNEAFTVTLANPTKATIADGTATGTITDDDGPALNVANASVTEGNTGTNGAAFSVSLTDPSPQVITVDYATADDTATVADDDYTAVSTATLTFAANTTTPQTVTVEVKGDTNDETDETFTLDLSSPTNATISDGTGLGTITDDDGPTLSIDNVTIDPEGFTGTTTNAQFTVGISASSVQAVTVDYATADDTATDPDDYTETTGTLTFPAGSTASQTITVPVKGDTLDEDDETFAVSLSNPSGGSLADGEGTGTITDDDDGPSLAIGDVTVTEGDDEIVIATFAVTLSTASGRTVTVNYATDDGDAVAGEDYTAKSGTVTFNPGQTTRTITVTVLGDEAVEGDEMFFVDLTDPTNASLDQDTGTGTIENDDSDEGTPPPPPEEEPAQGYWLTASDGGLFSYGESKFYGSQGGKPLNKPIVGMAPTPSGKGYWQVASDGGIFSYGDATMHGSMGGQPLNKPVVGMAATPDAQGYWLVASDGGIFSFGAAATRFYGSMGGQPLNKPIVGMAVTPTGRGYWLVASDGGIFSFGDATMHGSMGGKPLNSPIVGMAATPDAQGYWLVAADGGVFSFGAAASRFYGSLGGIPLDAPVVGMASSPTGMGYWIVGADGLIFTGGDAEALGSMEGEPLNKPIVGMAAFPG